jgi:hypothetical protein
MSDDDEYPYQDGPDEQPDGPYPPSESEHYDSPDESLADLLEDKRQAIKDLDFDLAKQLQRRIALLSERKSNRDIQDFKDSFAALCDERQRVHRRKEDAIIRKFHDEEIQKRGAATDAFEKLRDRQIAEIRKLEEDQQIQLAKRVERPIPEFDDMLRQAQQLASRDEFDEASLLREKAHDIQKAQLDQRLSSFEDSYKAQLNALLDKQEADLRQLTDGISVTVSKIESQRSQELHNEMKRFTSDLDGVYQRQRGLVRCYKVDPRRPVFVDEDGNEAKSVVSGKTTRQEGVLIVTKDERQEVLAQLSTWYNETLTKFHLGEDLEPGLTPPKPAFSTQKGGAAAQLRVRAGSRFSSKTVDSARKQ